MSKGCGLKSFDPFRGRSLALRLSTSPALAPLFPAMSSQPTIIYTKTDEAPALATYSLLPIVQAFTPADAEIEESAISS